MKTIFCFDHHNYGALKRPRSRRLCLQLVLLDWRHVLTHWAGWNRSWPHEQKVSRGSFHCVSSPTLQPVCWRSQKYTPDKTSDGGGQSADILDSTPRMLSLDLAAFSGSEPSTSQRHEARLGCKSSARHPASPSQPLSVTRLVSVHTLLEKCWANTEEQSQRLILLSH